MQVMITLVEPGLHFDLCLKEGTARMDVLYHGFHQDIFSNI